MALGTLTRGCESANKQKEQSFLSHPAAAQGWLVPARRSGEERVGPRRCYEASPRELSRTAPPLRICDQIVLVTTSSCGRCWVLQRIKCCEKQLWCSLILPTRITGKQLSHATAGMALNICMPGVLPSFNLFIFH